MHELSGSSTQSWDAAVLDAIAHARTEIDGDVVGFEVVRVGGEVTASRIRAYRATVRVVYRDKVTGPGP